MDMIVHGATGRMGRILCELADAQGHTVSAKVAADAPLDAAVFCRSLFNVRQYIPFFDSRQPFWSAFVSFLHILSILPVILNDIKSLRILLHFGYWILVPQNRF